MLTFEEFCQENMLDKDRLDSYTNYGFYCQGWARALIEGYGNGK